MPADVTIRCPGCDQDITCTAYSWITPTVVGRWLVPDHPYKAMLLNAKVYGSGDALVATLRCVWSGALLERVP